MAYDSIPHDPVTITLERAKWLIEQHGWGQGTIFRIDDNNKNYDYCILGALATAAKDSPLYEDAVERIVKVLPPIPNLEKDKHPVPHYNDYVAMSKEEVLQLFDKAINNGL